MDAAGFWDHLPVVFTVPKLVLCVDFVWEERSEIGRASCRERV